MYTESVQENDLHFPIINYFVAMGGQSYSAFLAQVLASKGMSGAGTFLLNWKKSRRKVAVQIRCSCSADASHFPALMPTDTKTNIKEKQMKCVCLHACPTASNECSRISYFVIH